MIGAIWAHAHGVLGKDGQMPWHVPEDLAHFKATTRGAAVLMGRTTWQSLPDPYRPLPGRENFVASRTATLEGAAMVRDVAAFLDQERWRETDLWVIGGAKIYAQALGVLDRAVVTEIDLDVAGDTFAPTLPGGALTCGTWRVSRAGPHYRFCTWVPREPHP